ncbi:MAG: WbqC family protein [Bacteroidota bacterium]
MKLAIMQPYLFPYIGYYQLVNAVDKFVVYDDVNFIKQGWINRNAILVNGKPNLFTVPLENQSSFSKINETLINQKIYPLWKKKFLKTIEQNYNKAPFFQEVFPIIQSTFDIEAKNIAALAAKSLKTISNYIGITTVFEDSSTVYQNQNLSSQNRVLDICKKENTSVYINPIGGLELYSVKDFSENNITLHFLKSGNVSYKQFNPEFVPNLSIIDVLMFNDVNTIKEFLTNYELI